jgi:N-acetylneuraminic acid mutarotase
MSLRSPGSIDEKLRFGKFVLLWPAFIERVEALSSSVIFSAMRKLSVIFALFLCAPVALAQGQAKLPSMPAAVSGNAVASLKGGFELFSFMGVGPKESWDSVSKQVYMLSLGRTGKWSTGRQVPGPVGRLNAAAGGVKGVIVLMGGFVVDKAGSEITIPDVNVYEPGARRWSRGKDIAIPVDSAVSGVIHDHFVYLIAGRSATGPVTNVQIYDLEKDNWTQATPFPGTPAFGMAGGIADEQIVIVDGAKAGPHGGARYVASEECWLGKIDRKDSTKIDWSKLPPHPGTAHFGIAGAGSNRDHKIYFSGGTTSPHDYTGASYDGNPTEVSAVTFDFDLRGHRWEMLDEHTEEPRADGRGLVDTPLGAVLLGGLDKNLAVTDRATLLPRK